MEWNIGMKKDNIKRLIKTYLNDWKEFSFSVALGRFVRDFPILPWEKRRLFYENKVSGYLNKKFGRLIRDYQVEKENRPDEIIIWVMWWQGIEDMPECVKACYNRLKTKAKNRIVLITSNNLNEWIDLPKLIIDKHQKGIITTTHFSDIVRAALLKKYGGLWLDSTIFIKEIPSWIFENEIYTLRAPGLFPDFISRGGWSPFLLFGKNTNMRIYSILDAVFSMYWETHNRLIDYLLIDFVIDLILKYNSEILDMIKKIQENRDYFLLNLSINEEYNKEKAKNMMKSSPFQKLTYKKKFLLVNSAGKETNYARIITGRFGDE